MAKRFKDTEYYNDSWIYNQSIEIKLLYDWLFMTCNWSGIIDLNLKKAQDQTGIKDLIENFEDYKKELGNRFIHLYDNYYFLPNFIKWQFPNFPRSKVHQQESALKELKEFGLWDEKNQEIIPEYNHSKKKIKSKSEKPKKAIDPDNFKVILPFDTPAFLDAWDLWKRYKKQQFKWIYKPIGEQGAAKHLDELSGHDEEKAIRIIYQSIAKGWKGFVELKDVVSKTGELDKLKEKIYKNVFKDEK